MKRTVIYIATDGTSAIDLSTVASATDMVITSEPYRRGDGRNMDKLTIDAPVIGEISTEKQRDAVNRWVTNWLEKRTKLFGKTVEESARIKTEVRKEKDGDDPDKIWEIPSITVEVPYGKLSSEQIIAISEKLLAWLEATGKKVEKKPADKPADKKPSDKGTVPPVKPADKKPADKKPGDKPADKKPADKKPGDKKPADKKPGDKKPGDKKPADKPADKKPTYKVPQLSAEDIAILDFYMPED